MVSLSSTTSSNSSSSTRSLSLQSSASEMQLQQTHHHHQPLHSVVMDVHKCRYKTGKCNNARSSKRNGQPHQLCLYHRDKANQIQRKFDRQKRQVMRERKTSSSSSSTASSALSSLHLSHHQYYNSSTPRFRSSSSSVKELDLYSDSDSSRFSTDSSSSDSSVASTLDQVWQDLPSPVSAAAMMALSLTPTAALSPPASASTASGLMGVSITPTASHHHAQGHLSHDEIDFLCSAMLE